MVDLNLLSPKEPVVRLDGLLVKRRTKTPPYCPSVIY